VSAQPPFYCRVETAEDRDRRRRYLPKGRSFGAQLIACQMAHGFWEGSERDPLRPTFALFATSRQEAGPFLVNLRRGRRIRATGIGYDSKGGWPIEFLKSADYSFNEQKVDAVTFTNEDEGTATTQPGTLIEVFLRPCFEFKPGMHDPDEVCFVLSLSAERLRLESERTPQRGVDVLLRRYNFEETRKHWYEAPPYDRATVVAEGLRFAAALNERCLLPIPPEPLFCANLLLSALAKGMAKRNQRGALDFSPDDRESTFQEVGMALAKRAPGLAQMAEL